MSKEDGSSIDFVVIEGTFSYSRPILRVEAGGRGSVDMKESMTLSRSSLASLALMQTGNNDIVTDMAAGKVQYVRFTGSSAWSVLSSPFSEAVSLLRHSDPVSRGAVTTIDIACCPGQSKRVYQLWLTTPLGLWATSQYVVQTDEELLPPLPTSISWTIGPKLRFSPVVPVDRPIYLHSSTSNLVACVTGGADRDGAPIALAHKTNAPEYIWCIRPVRGEEGWYRIVSNSTGRALHNHGGGHADGAPCTTWHAHHPGNNLKVKFEPVCTESKEDGDDAKKKDKKSEPLFYISYKQGACVCVGAEAVNGMPLSQEGKKNDARLHWGFSLA